MPHPLTDGPIEPIDPVVVAEQLEEGGLRARRAADAAESECVEPELELLQVEDEILQPERAALSDRRRLGRLEVGVPEGGHVAVAAGEVGERLDAEHDPVANELKGVPMQDQVRVVPDERRRGTQVDDARRGGGVVAEEVDVRHHVVAEATLVLGGLLEVDGVERRAHLIERLLRDVQPDLPLALREREPQAAPRPVAVPRREDLLHLGRRVAVGERMAVAIEVGHDVALVLRWIGMGWAWPGVGLIGR